MLCLRENQFGIKKKSSQIFFIYFRLDFIIQKHEMIFEMSKIFQAHNSTIVKIFRKIFLKKKFKYKSRLVCGSALVSDDLFLIFSPQKLATWVLSIRKLDYIKKKAQVESSHTGLSHTVYKLPTSYYTTTKYFQ